MAKAPILSDVDNILNGSTIINSNNDKIENAFQNTLSRDGSTPNQMETDLDMNNNDIINVDNLHINGTFVLNGFTVTSDEFGPVATGVDEILTEAQEAAAAATVAVDTANSTLASVTAIAADVEADRILTEAARDEVLAATLNFNTLADVVVNTDITVGEFVAVRGYLEAGDWTQAIYRIAPLGTATANGVSVVNLTGIFGQAILTNGSGISLIEAAQTGNSTAQAALVADQNNASSTYIYTKVNRIKPEWGGAKADKTSATATTAAILAAAKHAVKIGGVLHLSNGAQYAIDSTITLPEGLKIQNDGATFYPTFVPVDPDTPIIIVQDGTHADTISMHIDSGVGNIARMISIAADCHIGKVSVTADDHIVNGGITNNCAGAVLIENADRTRIGLIETVNFRNAWGLNIANDVIIEGDRTIGCWASTRWQMANNCHLLSGYSQHVPKTVREIGDLGFIGAGLTNCSVSNRTVVDNGEHAFRLGGDGLYLYLIGLGWTVGNAKAAATTSGFSLVNCRAIRSLGCAFKTQPGQYVANDDIRVTGLIGEDIDNGKGGGGNSSFIRLTNSSNIMLSGCKNIKVAQAWSGGRGLSIEGCDYVSCRDMDLGTTNLEGCFITTSNPDAASRSISEMDLEFRTTSPGTNGFQLNVVDNSDIIRRMSVRMRCYGATTNAVNISARPDTTTPLISTSLFTLDGYLANSGVANKSIAAAYVLNRFQDHTISF